MFLQIHIGRNNINYNNIIFESTCRKLNHLAIMLDSCFPILCFKLIQIRVWIQTLKREEEYK